MTELTDVMIIGGGPSGLHTAKLLSEKGVRVTLFDKDSEIGKEVVCSGVVSKEAFSRYDLPQNAILGALQSAELNSPSSINIEYHHPEQAVVVVDRHKFDATLSDYASASGAEIRTGSRVSRLNLCNDYVEATVTQNSIQSAIRAKIAVIATGVSFNLQSSLGLGRPEKILKGIQIEVKAPQIDKLRIHWGSNVSDGFFGWAIPIAEGRTRVGVMTDGNPTKGLRNLLSTIGDYTNICTDLGKVKRRGIAFGTINKSFSDRVVVVGEAAGLVKTTTGGGIYYGLISGEMAADTIYMALQNGDTSAKTLSNYEKMWKKSIGNEISFGKYFHRFYSKLGDDSVDALFEAAEKDKLLSFIAEQGSFDWHKNAVIRILQSPNIRKVLLWDTLLGARKRVSI